MIDMHGKIRVANFPEFFRHEFKCQVFGCLGIWIRDFNKKTLYSSPAWTTRPARDLLCDTCSNPRNRPPFLLARRLSPAVSHGTDHKCCKNSRNSLTDTFGLLLCLIPKAVRRRSSIACIKDNHHATATGIQQLVLRAVYVRDLARARSSCVGTGAE